jgi:hypothetical protein
MSPGVQNMKTGPDVVGTVQNELGRAKHENGTRRLRYPENEYGDAKHENGTQRHRNRRK